MLHLGTKTIETPHLLLRRASLEDAPAMFANWACDPEVTAFLTWPAHDCVQTTEKVLQSWISGYDRQDFYQWVIVCKEEGPEPIGSISVVQLDDRLQMAQLGYCLGKAWWHRGIMTQALRAVMDFLFDQVGINRIEAIHDVKNPRSGAVMRACGMRYEGTHFQAETNNRGLCDVCRYSLLAGQRRKPAPAVSVAIRAASAADFPAVQPLQDQLALLHHRQRPDLLRPDPSHFTEQAFLRRLEDPKHTVLVAETADGEIVGCAFAWINVIRDHPVYYDHDCFCIEDLCVLETYRHCGIGTKLLEQCRAIAVSKGCRSMELGVWAFNRDAAAFYAGFGMQERFKRMELVLVSN